MKKILLFACVAILGLSGCGFEKETSKDTATDVSITYTNEEGGFTLTLPNTWQILSTSSLATQESITREAKEIEKNLAQEDGTIEVYNAQIAIQVLDAKIAEERRLRCSIVINDLQYGDHTFDKCAAYPAGIYYLSYFTPIDNTSTTLFVGSFSRDGVFDQSKLETTTEDILSTLTFTR